MVKIMVFFRFYDDSVMILWWFNGGLPSGKHTKNYGTSPLFMGKSAINGDFPQLC